MSKTRTILVVEDDKPMRETCVKLLARDGYNAVAVPSGRDALIEIKKANAYRIVLTDLKMPDMDGIELLKQIKKYDNNIDVIIMTGFGTIKNAVEAIRLGAVEYITKPFNKDELLVVIKKVLKVSELQAEIERLRCEITDKYGFSNMIGKSSGMRQVYEKIVLASKNDSSVLISGESGTGKELVARAIHYNDNGVRAHKRFVPIDCPALPKELFESELFGHKKGAFTGATGDYQGLFKSAQGGTIFLDEITEMPQAIQAKLLRSLQERKIRSLGSTEEVPIDIRVMAATNRDVSKAVAQGLLREDLFYRLSVIQITIPPMRERKEDISLLAEYFIKKQAPNNRGVKTLAPEATRILLNHDWPGNVRELENVIEQAVLVTRSNMIGVQDLPAYLLSRPVEKESLVSFDLAGKDQIDFSRTLQQVEKELIQWALTKCGDNQGQAADLLKIPRSTFRDKMSKLETG